MHAYETRLCMKRAASRTCSKALNVFRAQQRETTVGQEQLLVSRTTEKSRCSRTTSFFWWSADGAIRILPTPFHLAIPSQWMLFHSIPFQIHSDSNTMLFHSLPIQTYSNLNTMLFYTPLPPVLFCTTPIQTHSDSNTMLFYTPLPPFFFLLLRFKLIPVKTHRLIWFDLFLLFFLLLFSFIHLFIFHFLQLFFLHGKPTSTLNTMPNTQRQRLWVRTYYKDDWNRKTRFQSALYRNWICEVMYFCIHKYAYS